MPESASSGAEAPPGVERHDRLGHTSSTLARLPGRAGPDLPRASAAIRARAEGRGAAAPAVPDSLDRMNQAIDGLTRKVWPSVVQIMVTGYGAREDAGRGERNTFMTRQRSMGSGFVIDPEGYIMTNAHVVSGAQRVQVVLPPINADGSLMSALSPKMTVMPARIVGVSSEIDLALLKVDGLKAPALPLATYRDVRQGETVFAFGSPGGLRNTLTHGLISPSRARPIRIRRSSTSRPTRRSIPATPAVRWSTSAAKSSASTRSSCRSRAATKASASRSRPRRRGRSSVS